MVELRSKGVQTQDSSPAFALTHEKALIVDGSSALIMSLNLVAATFQDTRDIALADSDPSDVAEIESVFQADWDRQTVAVARPALVWSPDNARPRIIELLTSATVEVDMYAEELRDQEVIATLEALPSQGVRVRLLMTGTGNGDSSRVGRSRLVSAGGEARLLQKPFVHAKMIVVDGTRAFAGSINLSAQSLDRNRELGLLTDDSALLSALSGAFEQDWSGATPVVR
jgi:phosphatidylserine/phosphatidylglycerophosphate/cardiolipin synthase-like enzyme